MISKNEKERNEYNDLLDKYQMLANSQKINIESFSVIDNQSDPKNLKQKSGNELLNFESKKKIPRINSYEVEVIGTEIKYGLLLKRIGFDEIEQVISLLIFL